MCFDGPPLRWNSGKIRFGLASREHTHTQSPQSLACKLKQWQVSVFVHRGFRQCCSHPQNLDMRHWSKYVSKGFQGAAFWLSRVVVQCNIDVIDFLKNFHRQTAESFCIPSPLVSFSRLHFVIVPNCIYTAKRALNHQTESDKSLRVSDLQITLVHIHRSGARCVGSSIQKVCE